ncbi:hypothetical protein V5O48_001892 [Marasmius crinis-equi]|uniref:Endo-chitosanase n=1 Tax=Marasmius crinis-equi TaxID=585013 RepID=A0ABR3FXC9_9AGAR
MLTLSFRTCLVAALLLFPSVATASPMIESLPALYSHSEYRRTAEFAADPSIVDPTTLYNAVSKATNWRLATYPDGQAVSNYATIYADWLYITGSSVLHFIADMDVDCDGVSYLCTGNKSGYHETSYGHLDASQVPYYVIPARFLQQYYPKVQPNALGAIICNGKILYGILGDTNGAETQVIGEASYMLARTCFPEDNLGGNRGHTPHDIAYIVFGNQIPQGIEDKTIDIDALKKLGDEQLRMLVTILKL